MCSGSSATSWYNGALPFPRTIRFLSRKVDRLDLNVLFECVFVDKDNAPTEVNYVKLPRDVIMLQASS